MFLISDILTYLFLVGQCKITFWQRSPACVLPGKVKSFEKRQNKNQKSILWQKISVYMTTLKAFNILHIKRVKDFMHLKYFDTPHL